MSFKSNIQTDEGSMTVLLKNETRLHRQHPRETVGISRRSLSLNSRRENTRFSESATEKEKEADGRVNTKSSRKMTLLAVGRKLHKQEDILEEIEDTKGNSKSVMKASSTRGMKSSALVTGAKDREPFRKKREKSTLILGRYLNVEHAPLF